MVEVNPPFCRLMDMQSSNGTFVNDTRVKTVDLKDGDVIQGGDTEILVSIQNQVESADDQSLAPTIAPPENIKINLPNVQPDPAIASPEDAARGTGKPAYDSVLPDSASLSEFAAQKELETLRHDSIPIAPIPEATRKRLPPGFETKIRNSPQLVPGFQIVEELGRGAMGVVYLAVAQKDGSIVALKVIKPAVAAIANEVQRFLREAEILRKLVHPHIVAFHDIGDTRDQLFFSMDYVKGIDALKLLKRNRGPLSIPIAVDLTCQLLEALNYAHQKEFVHRDIKPANL